MDKILVIIDGLINRIPGHIRDIIQKAGIAVLALIALWGVVRGIQRGIEDATPGGMQLFQKNRDLFYVDQLKEENEKRERLVEDPEFDSSILDEQEERLLPEFRSIGPDTSNKLIGEKDKMFQNGNLFRQRDNDVFDTDENIQRNILPGNPSDYNPEVNNKRRQKRFEPGAIEPLDDGRNESSRTRTDDERRGTGIFPSDRRNGERENRERFLSDEYERNGSALENTERLEKNDFSGESVATQGRKKNQQAQPENGSGKGREKSNLDFME